MTLKHYLLPPAYEVRGKIIIWHALCMCLSTRGGVSWPGSSPRLAGVPHPSWWGGGFSHPSWQGGVSPSSQWGITTIFPNGDSHHSWWRYWMSYYPPCQDMYGITQLPPPAPGMDGTWTGYAAGSTPFAGSRRRTFLFEYFFVTNIQKNKLPLRLFNSRRLFM